MYFERLLSEGVELHKFLFDWLERVLGEESFEYFCSTHGLSLDAIRAGNYRAASAAQRRQHHDDKQPPPPKAAAARKAKARGQVARSKQSNGKHGRGRHQHQ